MTEGSMVDGVERLREELYAWCGRSTACRRAADYYIVLIQNPCYPPANKMTYKMRKFYMEIVSQHGYPPRCDVRKLVEERLRGTIFEQYINEIAELAEQLKRTLNTTSRVAAAVAAAVVADARGVNARRYVVAGLFGTNTDSIRVHYRHALNLYRRLIAKS
jgi:hypothetical protein